MSGPMRYAHINSYGKYQFDKEAIARSWYCTPYNQLRQQLNCINFSTSISEPSSRERQGREGFLFFAPFAPRASRVLPQSLPRRLC